MKFCNKPQTCAIVHTYHSHHSCINMPLCDKQEKIPQVSFHQQFLFRSEHLWSLCCTWCPSWKDAPRPVSILSLRSASKLSKAKKGNWARSHKLTLDRAYSTTAAQRSLRPQSLPKSFWFFHREEWDFLKYTNTMKIANCSNQLEDIWLNWNHACTMYNVQYGQICQICIFGRGQYGQVGYPWKDLAKCSSDALVLGQ